MTAECVWPSGFVAVSAVHVVGDDGYEYDFDLLANSEWAVCGPTVTMRFENGTWIIDV